MTRRVTCGGEEQVRGSSRTGLGSGPDLAPEDQGWPGSIEAFEPARATKPMSRAAAGDLLPWEGAW